MHCSGVYYLLDKPITTRTASCLLLLNLYEFEIAKRAKDTAKVILSHREVDVTNVEAVERSAVGWSLPASRITRLAVLLRFGLLHDDGDAIDLLAG